MRASKLLLGMILFSTIPLLSCEKTEWYSSKGQLIAYGASFGECAGACFQEIRIGEDREVQLNVRYQGVDQKDQSFTTTIDSDVLLMIKSDASIQDLDKLDDIYGCPDCADGGAEWIEWFDDGQSIKKVTFEYGNPPKELEKVIDLLRKQKELLSEQFIIQN